MELIGIIGIGFVGSAIQKSLLEKNNNIIAYDKFKNLGNFDDILKADFVFLCLPTPYSDIDCSYDKSALYEICAELKKNNYRGIIVLKSTIEPTTSQFLADEYNLAIIHNPEFLTARTAYEDFHNQNHVIIGKTTHIDDSQIDTMIQFYVRNYPHADISICESTESESIKIFCNSFYAVKVQFFNELYLLCQKLNINYSLIKNIMLKNGWINPMHTDVPGPDGLLSYGGACFPKDTNALLSFMKLKNSRYDVLEAVINERNKMRTNE